MFKFIRYDEVRGSKGTRHIPQNVRGTWVEIVEVRASFALSLMGHLRLHVEILFGRCRNNISYVY